MGSLITHIQSFNALKLFTLKVVPKVMRKTQLIIIILLSLGISSCGLVKTLYNNAPEAVHWWLDDYFDFTHAQSEKLKPALHGLHDWHRKTQLALYIEILRKTQDDFSKEKIEPSAVCETIKTVQDNMQTIQLEASPIILEMAPLLADKQLGYFQKMLQKRADKWKSEWLQDTREEQLEARLDKSIDYAERLYGDLNKSQKSMLKQKLLALNFKPEISYNEILRRNDDALQIVTALKQENQDQAHKKALLKQGFERLRHSPNISYQNYTDQVKQQSCEMIADLHASTDAKQKQHAKAWFENFIAQFGSLMISKP